MTFQESKTLSGGDRVTIFDGGTWLVLTQRTVALA